MTAALYSPEVFMPDWFEKPTARVKLKYSNHARRESRSDRYGTVRIFESIPLSKFNVVEMEANTETREVTKLVVRGRLTETLDMVFVLIPGKDYHFVKTVWLNERTDTHKTLRREGYATS